MENFLNRKEKHAGESLFYEYTCDILSSRMILTPAIPLLVCKTNELLIIRLCNMFCNARVLNDLNLNCTTSVIDASFDTTIILPFETLIVIVPGTFAEEY